ncbi:hypothetical protein PEC301619_00990 [Pectobacterium carotovorum subsp. carotovorum]|nr:hypothetical protein PEC301619_00990 [Pectobacterium carotovorum subsp. carotovorum]GKW06890.1 hypothetical protein PEC301889_13730 [Pectobacterium carotovorum subsp. carotovorum]
MPLIRVTKCVITQCGFYQPGTGTMMKINAANRISFLFKNECGLASVSLAVHINTNNKN